MASRSSGRNDDRTSTRANAGSSTGGGSGRSAASGRTNESSSGGGTSAGGRTGTAGSSSARRPSAATSSASPSGTSPSSGATGSQSNPASSSQSSTGSSSQSNTGSSGPSVGASASSSVRGDQERELQTSREGQGNMRPAASRQRGNIGQQGRESWGPMFGSSSPFAMMRRMMEDMDRLFSDFGISYPGTLASSFLTPGTWGSSQSAVGSGSSGGQSVSPTSSRQGLQRGSQGISPAALRSLWAPQVEVFERGNNLVIRADLPGLSREDVDVEVDDDALIIRGERHNDVEDEQEGYYRSERSYGSFYRAIPLPDNVDASQCNATFRDGVLEVTLPKPQQQTRAKKIDVR